MPQVDWPFDKLPSGLVSKKEYETSLNYFGTFGFNDKGDIIEDISNSGSCHYGLNSQIFNYKNRRPENRPKTLYLWVATTYNAYGSWKTSLASQNKWFEYTIDPNFSPWREVINAVPFSVVRSKRGNIVALVMEVPDINTVALFHWFKGLRAIRENRALIFIRALEKGITDPDLLYKLYILSSYFPVNQNPGDRTLERFMLSIGHDHTAFKKKINKKVLTKTLACDLSISNLLLSSSPHIYYGHSDMNHHVFGMQSFPESYRRYYNESQNPAYNQIRDRVVKLKVDNTPKPKGYFTEVLERVDLTKHYSLTIDHFIDHADTLVEILS